jgi:hypothetical protein
VEENFKIADLGDLDIEQLLAKHGKKVKRAKHYPKKK